MSTIEYLQYASGPGSGGALVQSQGAYATAAPTGVVPGLADPSFANKAWRQSSMVAAAVANFISATLGIDVLDDGNLTTLIANLTAALEVAASSGIAVGMNAPTNLQIKAVEAGNNLTISLVGTNGSAPSASNPITIPFRDPTIATGDLVTRQLTSALSFTINANNTMGVAANNQPFRLWVVAFDNGGTVCLGAINCSTTSQVFPLNEDAPQTSQNVTNGGSTAGLFYANVANIAAKSIRILGYIEFGNGLANTNAWATAFTEIQLFGPGQHHPGQVVQSLFCTTTAQKVGTPNATKIDFSGWSPAPTPTLTSKANLVRLRLSGNMSAGTGANATCYVQMFRGTDTTVIGNLAPLAQGNAAQVPVSPVYCEALDLPQTLTPTYGGFIVSTTGTTAQWLTTTGSVPAGSGQLAIEEIMG